MLASSFQNQLDLLAESGMTVSGQETKRHVKKFKTHVPDRKRNIMLVREICINMAISK
jgi:hypothetical protein